MRKRLDTGTYDIVPEELRGLPPVPLDAFVRVVLPILAVLVAVLLAFASGCAHKPNVGDVVDGLQLGLAFTREGVAELEPLHTGGTDAAIAYCKATVVEPATEEQRTACLRSVGFSAEQIAEHKVALEQLAAAYDSIADALQAIEDAWPVLERMADHAKAVQR